MAVSSGYSGSDLTTRPSNFPEEFRHTRTCQIFYEIWNTPSHPRHRQLHDAISPKLWACRCFPIEPFVQDPHERENWGDLCPQFEDRYAAYAYLGGGIAGRAWAARRQVRNADRSHHFAVKIEEWPDDDTTSTIQLDTSHPARKHIKLIRYFKLETLIQTLVGDMAANIPRIIEVYSHQPSVVIVMDLVAYRYENRLNRVPQVIQPVYEYPNNDSFLAAPRLYPCTATVFMDDYDPDEMWDVFDTGPRSLGEWVEAQMCMILHGLLQAVHHMFDQGVTHLDFEDRNVLVDANFQGYLIDFSMARLHAREADYHVEGWNDARQHHDPEWRNPDLLIDDRAIRTDGRRLDLWSLACLGYSFLHKADPARFTRGESNKIRHRRQMKRPVNVRENLSQDGSDMLQASLEVFPLSRPNVEELCTFPWFSGWQYDSDDVDFTNPYLFPYRPGKTQEQVDEEFDAETAADQAEEAEREQDLQAGSAPLSPSGVDDDWGEEEL